MTSRAKTLRDLLNAPAILTMPGVYDGFSARMVQQSGFKAGFVTGGGIAETIFGHPDIGLMGLEDNLSTIRPLVACTDIPLLADADTGYGNAINVFHTTRAFEQAGVAGMMIEDQVFPKRCGHLKGKRVVPVDEMLEKIAAAVEARRDPDFVLKGRTDAFATHGIQEVIKRLNLYAEAGADLLFADALTSEADIALVAKEVPKPLCVNMGFGIRARPTTPLISAKRLQEIGVAAAIYPRLLTGTAVRGMMNGMAALQKMLETGECEDRPDLCTSFEELSNLVDLPGFEKMEQKFAKAWMKSGGAAE